MTVLSPVMALKAYPTQGQYIVDRISAALSTRARRRCFSALSASAAEAPSSSSISSDACCLGGRSRYSVYGAPAELVTWGQNHHLQRT